MPATVTVATLVGHRQLELGLSCLKSLLECSEDRILLRVHDDGTLEPEDVARLERDLGAIVVRRVEADDLASDRLTGHPRAAAYRRESPLALKLLDVALLAEKSLFYVDSDVLFVRKFRGLFVEGPQAPRFMADTQDAYSVRPWDLLRWPELRLVARLNSGVIAAPIAVWDLDRIEWFLGLPGLRPAVWIEQTCWAMLASRLGSRLLDADQFEIARAGLPASDTVAIHFVSPKRDLFARVLQRLEGSGTPMQEEPVQVASSPCVRCSTLDLTLGALRRKWSR